MSNKWNLPEHLAAKRYRGKSVAQSQATTRNSLIRRLHGAHSVFEILESAEGMKVVDKELINLRAKPIGKRQGT